MVISVNYNIIGSSPPFNFSVKDKNGIERFINSDGSKIYFTALESGIYKFTISNNKCQVINEKFVECNFPLPPSNTTPITVLCKSPKLSLIDINNKVINLRIEDNNNCSQLEFQYSLTQDFEFYTSIFKPCVNTTSIELPENGNYFIRVKKTCNNLNLLSNIISVSINNRTTNCYVYAGCLGIGNDPDYDTFRIVLSNPAEEDMRFELSNQSIITIGKGNIFGEEIINITTGCPFISNNDFNIPYCRNITPITNTPTPIIINYYELAGCNASDYAFTTIIPDGINQKFVLPSYPTPKFYTYTGSILRQNTAPNNLINNIQKTNLYNC